MEICLKINHWWVPSGQESVSQSLLSWRERNGHRRWALVGQWDIIHSSCFLVGDKNLCHSFGIFAALRWELCQFHSLLLLPSAVIGSSSKGQNKLLFNFFFFFFIFGNGTSDRKKWHCILVRLGYFPLHSPHCGLLKLLQERCDITFIRNSQWLSQLWPLSWQQWINPAVYLCPLAGVGN